MLLFSDVLYMLVSYTSPSGPMCLRCLMLTLSGPVELFLLCFNSAWTFFVVSVMPSSPNVSLASTSLITSCSWQTLSTPSSDHIPILIILQMKDDYHPGSTSNLCQPEEG